MTQRAKTLAVVSVVLAIVVGVLAGWALVESFGTADRVTKIESGIAQRCVKHAEADRARSKPCQRLLDAILKYASPAQREAAASGGVVASGGQTSSSGLASPGHSNPRGKAKGHRR